MPLIYFLVVCLHFDFDILLNCTPYFMAPKEKQQNNIWVVVLFYLLVCESVQWFWLFGFQERFSRCFTMCATDCVIRCNWNGTKKMEMKMKTIKAPKIALWKTMGIISAVLKSENRLSTHDMIMLWHAFVLSYGFEFWYMYYSLFHGFLAIYFT